MKYTVVHSKDPWLLARLATDLLVHEKKCISEDETPFDEGFHWLTCYIYGFKFYNHKCVDPDKWEGGRHNLTPKNYISVLTKILQS